MTIGKGEMRLRTRQTVIPADRIWAEAEKQMLEARRSYHQGEDANELSSLVQHHGLKDISPGLKEYIRSKVFIDAWAFVGDSALVMREHGPAKTIAFEPMPSIARKFDETMRHNAVSPGRGEWVMRGLSNSSGVVFCENNGGCECDSQGEPRIGMGSLDVYLRV